MSKTLFKPKISGKPYYKIGEVSAIVGIPVSVLNLWETEFENLKPKRSSNGDTLYRKSDIALVSEIKRLIYKNGLTIEGVKYHFASIEQSNITFEEIRIELKRIRDLLE